MKKNKMMRIASFLLVAVLLTTSVISGTFAKYVTADELVDSARVAEFGVVVSATGKLFSETYYNYEKSGSDIENRPAGDVLDENDPGDITYLTVESWNAADEVVAPGTQNTDGVTFAITGTPEVDVRINATIADTLKDVYLGMGTLPDMTTGQDKTFTFGDYDYYPIVYTLKGDFVAKFDADDIVAAGAMAYAKDVVVDGDAVSGNLIQIAQVLEYMFDEQNGGYYVDANTDLAQEIGSFTLTWVWQFEDKDDDGNVIKLQDQQDTLLGDLISKDLGYFVDDNVPADKLDAFNALTDYSVNVDINLTISVTQVD